MNNNQFRMLGFMAMFLLTFVTLINIQNLDFSKKNNFSNSGSNTQLITTNESDKFEKVGYQIEEVDKETVLDSNAKLTLVKHYNKCNHTEVKTGNLPLNFIGKSQIDIEKKYPNYVVQDFSADNIQLGVNIDTKCNEHFIAKDSNGVMVVYYQNQPTKVKVETDIKVGLLPKKDRENLKNGILIESSEELAKLLEDFNE